MWTAVSSGSIGRLRLVALATLALGGCSTPTADPPAVAARLPGAPWTLDEVPAVRLEPGQCALVLWSLTDRRRIVVTLGQPPHARIKVGGTLVDLPQVSASGQAGRQSFADQNLTLSLDLEFDPDRALPAGAVVRSGDVSLSDRAGWSMVIPVGGLAACEPSSGR